jgi:hypothetical protein
MTSARTKREEAVANAPASRDEPSSHVWVIVVVVGTRGGSGGAGLWRCVTDPGASITPAVIATHPPPRPPLTMTTVTKGQDRPFVAS